ncbi:hypothetical protein [Bifidobacterium moukalabense]|uniref:hypothetical protein n=1 Tax=Bifidobacterium moukalabense TaxID=1333651 RepID=UPI001FCEC5F7|nr:hypothetical protein [Bifidobacterium moukalabense]
MLETIMASEDEHSEQRNASPIARMIAMMLASVGVSRPFADGHINARQGGDDGAEQQDRHYVQKIMVCVA